MKDRAHYLQAKRTCGNMSWTMLVYYKILNEMVSLACIVDIVLYALTQILPGALSGAMPDFDLLLETVTNRMLTNAWGYLFAIALGMLILFAWKGTAFWKEEIWARGRPMTAATFFCLLMFVLSVQAPTQLTAPALEWVLNRFDLSAMAAMEAATTTDSSVSMFLYACFIGPFAEEILFRGLLLRTLKPYGKQTAILLSSVLFALFHGNIVQIPYAFLVGLVFAYVTLEHSIVWAVIFHIFNNFVLADLLSRLSERLPFWVGETLTLLLIYGGAIAAVVIALCRRREVAAWFRKNPVDNTAVKAFLASPGTWLFGALMLGSAAIMLDF